MTPFIIKAFESSTCHITEEDNNKLMSDDCELVVYPYQGSGIQYGMLVFADPETAERDFSELKDQGFSDALIKLLQIAYAEGCKFLQLDCDGTTYPELPQYDW